MGEDFALPDVIMPLWLQLKWGKTSNFGPRKCFLCHCCESRLRDDISLYVIQQLPRDHRVSWLRRKLWSLNDPYCPCNCSASGQCEEFCSTCSCCCNAIKVRYRIFCTSKILHLFTCKTSLWLKFERIWRVFSLYEKQYWTCDSGVLVAVRTEVT